MTTTVSDGAPSASIPVGVLRTRLLPPRLPPNSVPRPELVARVNRGLEGRLLAIIAGAGYGKTTLLVQALESSPLPWVWVSCDARLRSPEMLLAHVAAGVAGAFPGVATALPPGGSPDDQIAAPRQRDRGHDPRRLRPGAGRRPRARPRAGARRARQPGVGPATQRPPGDDQPPRPGHPHLPRGRRRSHGGRRGDARLQLLGGRRAARGRARRARSRPRSASCTSAPRGGWPACCWRRRSGGGAGRTPQRLDRAALRLPGRRGAGRPARGAAALPARHLGARAVHATARGGRLGAPRRPRGAPRPGGLAPVHRAGRGRVVPLPPPLRRVPAASPGRA